jgi:hypothetical protein
VTDDEITNTEVQPLPTVIPTPDVPEGVATTYPDGPVQTGGPGPNESYAVVSNIVVPGEHHTVATTGEFVEVQPLAADIPIRNAPQRVLIDGEVLPVSAVLKCPACGIPITNTPQSTVTTGEFAEVQPLPPVPGTTQPSPFAEVDEVAKWPEDAEYERELQAEEGLPPATIAETAAVEVEAEPAPDGFPEVGLG